ncbi:GNAT family N-acetyltransferase [Geothrix terrae]|uniref:GNAT family N-acetyltransferase n=1 Tax=Geothrix terrae TaxID=2922720 RepID=UPI001FACA3F9|nr:GNAT family N-acetyltransferase [Geothrix terrae]
MNIELTDTPREQDEAFVIAQVHAYNSRFIVRDQRSLCVFARDGDGIIIGGLTGRTNWQYLEVLFLWVHDEHRKTGLASKLMAMAESEAIKRGCKNARLDTFSFQALGFYQKLGYQEVGHLPGFGGQHTRHFLHKSLCSGA